MLFHDLEFHFLILMLSHLQFDIARWLMPAAVELSSFQSFLHVSWVSCSGGTALADEAVQVLDKSEWTSIIALHCSKPFFSWAWRLTVGWEQSSRRTRTKESNHERQTALMDSTWVACTTDSRFRLWNPALTVSSRIQLAAKSLPKFLSQNTHADDVMKLVQRRHWPVLHQSIRRRGWLGRVIWWGRAHCWTNSITLRLVGILYGFLFESLPDSFDFLFSVMEINFLPMLFFNVLPTASKSSEWAASSTSLWLYFLPRVSNSRLITGVLSWKVRR